MIFLFPRWDMLTSWRVNYNKPRINPCAKSMVLWAKSPLRSDLTRCFFEYFWQAETIKTKPVRFISQLPHWGWGLPFCRKKMGTGDVNVNLWSIHRHQPLQPPKNGHVVRQNGDDIFRRFLSPIGTWIYIANVVCFPGFPIGTLFPYPTWDLVFGFPHPIVSSSSLSENKVVRTEELTKRAGANTVHGACGSSQRASTCHNQVRYVYLSLSVYLCNNFPTCLPKKTLCQVRFHASACLLTSRSHATFFCTMG